MLLNTLCNHTPGDLFAFVLYAPSLWFYLLLFSNYFCILSSLQNTLSHIPPDLSISPFGSFEELLRRISWFTLVVFYNFEFHATRDCTVAYVRVKR